MTDRYDEMAREIRGSLGRYLRTSGAEEADIDRDIAKALRTVAGERDEAHERSQYLAYAKISDLEAVLKAGDELAVSVERWLEFEKSLCLSQRYRAHLDAIDEAVKAYRKSRGGV